MGRWREKISWEKLRIILNWLYQVRSIRKIDGSDFKIEDQGMRTILIAIVEIFSNYRRITVFFQSQNIV